MPIHQFLLHAVNYPSKMISKTYSIFFCLAFSLIFLLDCGSTNEDVDSNKSSRNPKWMNGYFPFIKLVIPPEPCGTNLNLNTINGNEVRNGVCLPRGKCEIMKGRKDGDCAKGFGECCKFTASCNTSNHEVFINEEVITLNTHSPLDTDCSYEFRRKPKFCALKLDFVQFTSHPADSNGICVNDSLTIRGSTTVPDGFQTCGNLKDQHMYLTFNKAGIIELIPSFTTTGGGLYQIVATQIPCVSPLRVPESCLQYYNSTRGVVKSFDYPRRQQSNQEYTICVGGTNAASITWRQCSNANSGGMDSFSIRTEKPSAITELPCRSDRDWVQINGQNQMCKKADIVNAGLRSSYTPFLLNVHFNELEKEPVPCLEDTIKLPMASCTWPLPMTGIPAKECIEANYDSCAWDALANPPSCTCSPIPTLFDRLDSDIDNIGFCLEYMQNSRK